jgi:hypothetical protein
MDEVLVGGEGDSFFSYMFSLSEGEKIDLLNMFQYLLLAIIPIMLVNKFITTYIPPVDRSKSLIEITSELVIQLVILFTFIYFIHKLILFIPTYSKNPYPTINFLPIILPVLIVLLSLDKNMHEKSSMMLNKVFVMLGLTKENFEEGDVECIDKKKKPKQVQSQMNFIEPPQTSQNVLINSDRIHESPSRSTDYDQQPGIQNYMPEPSAYNDVGGISAF